MNIPEAETCASTSRPSANCQKTSSSKKSIRQDLFHVYLLCSSYHWSSLICSPFHFMLISLSTSKLFLRIYISEMMRR